MRCKSDSQHIISESLSHFFISKAIPSSLLFLICTAIEADVIKTGDYLFPSMHYYTVALNCLVCSLFLFNCTAGICNWFMNLSYTRIVQVEVCILQCSSHYRFQVRFYLYNAKSQSYLMMLSNMSILIENLLT